MHQKQRAIGGSENLEGEDFDFIHDNLMGWDFESQNILLKSQLGKITTIPTCSDRPEEQ